MNSGQPYCTLTGMIAIAVSQCPGLHLCQAGKHVDTIAKWLERLECGAEFETGPLGRGRPMVLNRACRMVDESEPHYRLGRVRRAGREGWNHRIQQRQGQCCTYTTQKRSAWKGLLRYDHHGPGLLFMRNGVL